MLYMGFLRGGKGFVVASYRHCEAGLVLVAMLSLVVLSPQSLPS